jgi:hypothetical protein
MLTNEQMKELFEQVLDRMVEAGWLHSYTFTVGKGFWRNWHVEGGEHMAVLRAIVESHGLTDDDRSAMTFYELAKGNSLGVPLGFVPEKEDLRCFARCVDTLGLSGANELLVFCHIACWD